MSKIKLFNDKNRNFELYKFLEDVCDDIFYLDDLYDTIIERDIRAIKLLITDGDTKLEELVIEIVEKYYNIICKFSEDASKYKKSFLQKDRTKIEKINREKNLLKDLLSFFYPLLMSTTVKMIENA